MSEAIAAEDGAEESSGRSKLRLLAILAVLAGAVAAAAAVARKKLG